MNNNTSVRYFSRPMRNWQHPIRHSADLPAEVDENKAEAEFSKGVLAIKLPKSEEAQAKHKKIKIKSA